jgi:hypothetical protein
MSLECDTNGTWQCTGRGTVTVRRGRRSWGAIGVTRDRKNADRKGKSIAGRQRKLEDERKKKRTSGGQRRLI